MTGSRGHQCHKATRTQNVTQKFSLAGAIVITSGIKIVSWSLYSTWLFHDFNA